MQKINDRIKGSHKNPFLRGMWGSIRNYGLHDHADAGNDTDFLYATIQSSIAPVSPNPHAPSIYQGSPEGSQRELTVILPRARAPTFCSSATQSEPTSSSILCPAYNRIGPVVLVRVELVSSAMSSKLNAPLRHVRTVAVSMPSTCRYKLGWVVCSAWRACRGWVIALYTAKTTEMLADCTTG